MRLMLIVVMLLLSLSVFVSSVRAQSTESDGELADLASQANVTVENLRGAAFSTGLTAREYLYAVGELDRPSPKVDSGSLRSYSLYVRLTFYTYNSGVTYSEEKPYIGSAACSRNIPLESRIILPNGQALTCNDRGDLGWKGWIDVYAQPQLIALYGDYVTVEIVP